MSYKQAVLRDDPISFWPLDGQSTLTTYAHLLMTYPTYQDYINNESKYLQEANSVTIQDISNFGNHAAFTLGYPPKFSGASLISHSSYDTNNGGLEVNPFINVDILNLYNAFQGGYENKAFGIEFWVDLFAATPAGNTITFIQLNSGSNQRMSIYTIDNSIYFKIYFSDGSSQTVKKQVYSWESSLHIFASIKDGVQTISVNGISDENKSIPKAKSFNKDSLSIFQIPSSNIPYITNGLAFYDKILSSNQINNHIYFAKIDSDPVDYAKQSNVSHFSFNNTSGRKILSKTFNNESAFSVGTFNGLVTDKSGLTVPVAPQGLSANSEVTWVCPIVVTSYSKIAGATISWDSSSTEDQGDQGASWAYVLVSYDNGLNYYQVKNKKSIPFLITSYADVLSFQVLLKVTMFSPDTSVSNQPRIDNLVFNVYSDISETSDSGLFQIFPYLNSTYQIKQDSNNILSRSKNLGISFYPQDYVASINSTHSSKSGSALIQSNASSSYKSIEFWCSGFLNGGAILHSSSSTNTPDLYADQSGSLINTISGSTLYVNGVATTSGSFAFTDLDIYHIVLVYPSLKNSNILLNGDFTATLDPAQATYGYITIYPTALTSDQVKLRYLSYLQVQAGVARDNTTSIGQISEYSGTSSNINNGQPVAYHRHLDQNGS